MELSLPPPPVATRRPPPSPPSTTPRVLPTFDAAEVLAAPVRPDGGSHAVGFGIVVAVHVVVGYALLSGLAQKVVDVVRPPVEVRLIQEIKPPPPPPAPEPPRPVAKSAPRETRRPPPAYVPPPQVEVAAPAAPVIAAVTPTPPAPAPAPEPAPVAAAAAPVARPAEPVAIGVVCPTMVKPTLPRRAEEEGIGGSVRAQATIRGGKVVAVEILNSKPRGLFDAAVRAAMLQYQCSDPGERAGGDIVAVQNFQFRSAE